jgi:hypothetical protein
VSCPRQMPMLTMLPSPAVFASSSRADPAGRDHACSLVCAARESRARGRLDVLAVSSGAPLCDAAQWVLHGQFAQIYRPRGDDPRPYQDLLLRLGDGAQLPR